MRKLQHKWYFGWGHKGLSLLAYAHAFCRANVLTIAEFVNLFRVSECRDGQTTNELLSIEKSALSIWPLHPYGHKSTHWLFANSYRLTGSPKEVSRTLRYCPSCLRNGLHFSWQQLSWLETCPIHGEAIQDRCQCDKRLRYVLNSSNRGIGVLCRCGKLELKSRPQWSSAGELDRLKGFEKRLSHLRNVFARPVDLLRLVKHAPDGEELASAFDLTTTLLQSFVGPEATLTTEIGLEVTRYHDDYESVTREIQSWFRGASELVKRNKPRFEYHWQDRYVSGYLQRSLFNADVLVNVGADLRVGSDGRKPDEILVKIGAILFAKKVTQGIIEGRYALNGNHCVNLAELRKRYGRPLCLTTYPTESSQCAIAYSNAVQGFSSPGYSWVKSLARFLVVHYFYGTKQASRRERLLESALADRQDANYFRCFETFEPGPQMELFGEPSPRT